MTTEWMTSQWVLLDDDQKMIPRQWQFRLNGRSVAVVTQRDDDTWIGVMCGPSGLVVDMLLTGNATLAHAKDSAVATLRNLGWIIDEEPTDGQASSEV